MKKKPMSFIEEWDKIVPKWAEVVRNKGDLFREALTLPHTLKILGNLKGKKLLDLACGEGYNTRILAQKGVRELVGIDGSYKMIELAQKTEQEQPLGIKYYPSDAGKMKVLKDSYFDIAVSFMAIMDMEKLPPVAKEIYRVLKKQGKFVFSIPHPCFNTLQGHSWWIKEGDYQYRGVDNYSKREKQNVEFTLGAGKYNLGRMTVLHRTLADYINPFAKAGLFISKMCEAIPTKEEIRKYPRLEKHRRMPAVIIFEMIKGEKGTAKD
jgi:2-polyprenyl-3-methyl-5-hydroxy-6-metoxy-1,4-benzoquinol methylase